MDTSAIGKRAWSYAGVLMAAGLSCVEYVEQLTMLQQVGPLQDMLEKLPFFADSVPDGFQIDEGELDRIKAIVSSMTRAERKLPVLFAKQPSRVKRVAKGSGRTDKEVADLLQRFGFMQGLMGQIGKQAISRGGVAAGTRGLSGGLDHAAEC